jgi:AAA+ ATPase superfamily predicted ATPase
MDQFVDRLEELERLRSLYASDEADLAVVYGRRQIGKSELVRQSISGRDDAVYYQAMQGTPRTQLARFVEVAGETYPEITGVKEEWEPLLEPGERAIGSGTRSSGFTFGISTVGAADTRCTARTPTKS